VQRPAATSFTGNSTIEPRCKAALAAMEIGLSAIRTTAPMRVNKQEPLKPGERVELKGKKTKDESGEPAFEVHKMSKDLGSCTTTAEKR
jgi:hypothetical protein